MKRGLYRTNDPVIGECAYVDWGGTDGKPFLTRDTYEANRYQPPFDQLPTQEEYEAT